MRNQQGYYILDPRGGRMFEVGEDLLVQICVGHSHEDGDEFSLSSLRA